MLIEIQEVLDALEKEREWLFQREQFGAEHILVHHAIRIIEELKEQKEKESQHIREIMIHPDEEAMAKRDAFLSDENGEKLNKAFQSLWGDD